MNISQINWQGMDDILANIIGIVTGAMAEWLELVIVE